MFHIWEQVSPYVLYSGRGVKMFSLQYVFLKPLTLNICKKEKKEKEIVIKKLFFRGSQKNNEV